MRQRSRVRSRASRTVVATVAGALIGALGFGLSGCSAVPEISRVQLDGLPAAAVADYQLGGGYVPDPSVTVVTRDSTDVPAEGVYSICYVNGFQTQPGVGWPADLVLRDDQGEPLVDPNWPDEYVIDTSDLEKRARAADQLRGTIIGCADDGFEAVEFDNLDSYTRSGGRLTVDDAESFAVLLVGIAHGAGLAAGQKNAPDLARFGLDEIGFDFAVAEECDQYDECEAYTQVYGDQVIAIEYTDALRRPFAEVCADASTPDDTILRDRQLTVRGSADYAYDAC